MIFLDMDGVVADFDSHYEKHFGYRPTRWPTVDTTKWGLVNSVPDFYRTLPLMPGAVELFRYVGEVGEGVAFLTGIPVSVNSSANQKVEWASEHFPDTPIICCPAKNKCLYARSGDILIDDYLKYRVAWESANGIFIHHVEVPNTIRQLRELGKCALSGEFSQA